MTAQGVFPGDPGALASLGQQLTSLSAGLDEAARTLTQIETGAWQGQAADAFRNVIQQQPGKYASACSSFAAAGAAIQEYAQALSGAQRQAASALSEWDAAQTATRTWHSQSLQLTTSSLGGHDPGAAGRATATGSVNAARTELDAAAARLRGKLAQAASAAPKSPSFFERLFHDGEDFFKKIFGLGPSVAPVRPGGAHKVPSIKAATPPAPKLPGGKSPISNREIVNQALSRAPNGPAANEASAQVGQWGGQCRVFAQTVITAAGFSLQGAYANPAHDYYEAFDDAGAYHVPSPADAIPGDVVQIGEFESDPHLHTFIIVSNDPVTHTFTVVDSNAGWDERIRYYTRPYPTGDFRIYRLGQP